MVHPFSRLSGSLVEVVHMLLEFGFDAVGESGDDLGEPLVQQKTLSCKMVSY